MQRLSLFLVGVLCVQWSFIPSVYADDGGTSSGAIIPSSDTGTIIPSMNEKIFSGSVLTEKENTEQKNDTNNSLTQAISAQEVSLPPVQSPLIVRINEVAWMGSDLSTADEWIELTAVPAMTGAVVTIPVNLRGWTVSIQKDTGESVIASFNQDVLIGSGQYLVIANTAAAGSRLKNEPALISSAISLPNTKLLIRLRDPSSTLMDEVDDFVGAPFAGLNPSASSGLPKATMERIDVRKPGNDKTNWKTATTSRGLDAGANMRATPGFENGSIEPPDLTPPSDVSHVQAYSFSGSTLIGWTNSANSDASVIRLTAGTAVRDLPATATGITLSGAGLSQILIQTMDAAGNVSAGISQSVQSLPPWILSELIPDPAGSDEEWIELGNTSLYPLDLSGWVLQSGSKRFALNGIILVSTSYLLLPFSQTGLQLPNAGGEVQLRYRGVLIDHILYTEMPDGVSVGWHEDGSVRPFCVPTPALPNSVIVPSITVTGFLRDGSNPTSLNLEVKALSGSIAGASCSVDYGDGFTSSSCNPPSHAMKRSGHVVIKTEVHDFCGNTVIHTDDVLIAAGSKTKTPSLITQTQSCVPTATGGITVSEFLPAPVSGQVEWIELKNTSDTQINLCGWSIDDAVGDSHPYRLDALSIDAGQYLLIGSAQSGIALNNDADTVRLIAPDMHGGTGVLLAVPYEDAETDVSFARREDSVILQTLFPTPGSDNRFTAIDTSPGSSPVILSAALPNPAGTDTWDEWLELTNVTGRPQWLNGWHIEDTAGHRLPLDGRVLSKRETQRLALYKASFTLVNTADVLRLVDQNGAIRSVLAWRDVGEGKTVHLPSDCREEIYEHPVADDGLEIHAKDASGSSVILPIRGVLGASSILSLKNSDYNSDKNYLSALIKNKKIVSKNCSDNAYSSLSVDGADIALLLLENGFVFTDSTDVSFRYDEFSVYEDQSRKQRIGLWSDQTHAAVVDAWRDDRILDAIVENEGVRLTLTPDTPLLDTGAVISVGTNVPADLWLKKGTGAYRRFDGGVFVSSDTDLSFLAAYEMRTTSGVMIRTSEVSHSYAVKRRSYPACLRISEVYPSPKKGEHEWLELQNLCSEKMSLLGWSIDDVLDSGSKPFTFRQNLIIEAGNRTILSGALLPIALNNGGDSVILLDPNKRIENGMTYAKVSAGKSVAMLDEQYCVTDEPTIRMNNICVHKSGPTKSKKTGKSMVVAKIGTGLKYVAGLLQDGELSTKNDQFSAMIEGLNRNKNKENRYPKWSTFAAVSFFIIGLLTLSAGIILYMRKYRLFQ